MQIVIKENITVRWHTNNRKHYESIGFRFTKWNDNFNVVNTQLPRGSHIKIIAVCDNCGKRKEISFKTYNTIVDKSNKYLCKHCSSRTTEEEVENFIKENTSFKYIGMYYINDGSHNRCWVSVECSKHGKIDMLFQSIRGGYRCRYCANDDHSVWLTGKRSNNWQGGITVLSDYLRVSIVPWIQERLKLANYKCEITGKTGILNVHHMYSFRNILKDTMNELQLDIRPSIGDYSEEELQLIVVNFLKNNDLKAQPIVMLEEVHKEFHMFCGGNKEDTTFEQLDEFIKQKLKEEC